MDLMGETEITSCYLDPIFLENLKDKNPMI